MAREIVDLPIKNAWLFSTAFSHSVLLQPAQFFPHSEANPVDCHVAFSSYSLSYILASAVQGGAEEPGRL